MKTHAVADTFPLMDRAELERLVEDIRVNGLREPITLHSDGSILDGRNRERACAVAGVEPRFIEWDGEGSAVDFVLSMNLHRRHLNESQRAMVATRLATLRDGQRKPPAPIGAPTQPIDVATQNEAADMLNVSRRSLQRARRVIDNAPPEVVAGVDAGVISVTRAAAEVPKKPRKQSKSPQKKYAALWRQLRDSLEGVNGLPDAEMMVNVVPAAQRELVARRLPVVLNWLHAFDEAWTRKEQTRHGENPTIRREARDNHPGDGASG